MASRFVVLCLLGVAVATVLGQNLAVEPPTGNRSAADPSDDESFEDLKQGRIVAAQSAKTITTVTTSTTSVAETCATTINTAACKRKRRSMRAFVNIPGLKDAAPGSLDSSLLNQEWDEGGERSDKQGKLAYTVWWSTTSTYTITSRVKNGITVSVSYFCSVAGAVYPPICG